MTGRIGVALAILAMATCGEATAQRLDPSSQEALAAVLRILQDPAARGAAIAGNPAMTAADQRVQSLTAGSPALTQEVYDLAGRIFEDLTRAGGGDPQAMNQALARAQADPAAFASMLSPRTLELLTALATKLSDQPRR